MSEMLNTSAEQSANETPNVRRAWERPVLRRLDAMNAEMNGNTNKDGTGGPQKSS